VQIQDYLIAAIQNIRLLLKSRIKPVSAKAAAMGGAICGEFSAVVRVMVAVLAQSEVVTGYRADTMTVSSFSGRLGKRAGASVVSSK